MISFKSLIEVNYSFHLGLVVGFFLGLLPDNSSLRNHIHFWGGNMFGLKLFQIHASLVTNPRFAGCHNGGHRINDGRIPIFLMEKNGETFLK